MIQFVKYPGRVVRLALASILCLTTHLNASAACGGTQPYVSCGDVLITLLYIETANNAYIKVDGNPESMSCALNGGFITLPGTAPKFNAIYATLLAAQSAGRRVSIRMGPESQCTVAYVTLAAQ